MPRMSLSIRRSENGFTCPRCGGLVAGGAFVYVVNGTPYCETCGKTVSRDSQLAGPYRPSSGYRPEQTWPMHCDALMVADEDLAEAKAVTGCEYDRENRPIITSARHYREVQRRTGRVDRSAWC